jgi:uncharacterized RDD family membrane protein YckC
MQYAGVGWRLLAFILDILFIYLYFLLISYIFVHWLGLNYNFLDKDSKLSYDLNTFLEIIFTILMFPALFYSLWTEYFFNGQTFGKLICRIRVVKINGYRAGFTEYFTRWVFRLVDFWTGIFLLFFLIPVFGDEAGVVISGILLMLSGFLAFFLIIRTKNSQRLGDIVAGTTVLKLKEKHSIGITILEELKETYQPTYSQVLRLTDNDARIIKDTFTIALKNKDFATLSRLKNRLETVMEVQTNQSDSEFIDTVMKDFNYYTQKL